VRRKNLDRSIDHHMQKIGGISFPREFKTRGKFLQECASKQELDGLLAAAKKKPVALKVAPFVLAHHSIPDRV
jgi:hypothetical protein